MEFKIFKNQNIIQGVSGIKLGARDGRDKIRILKSYGRKIAAKNLIWPEQVFGAEVYICQKSDSGKIIKGADGLISHIPGQALAIVSADCVPILLFDPKNKVVAALHGSRKSLTEGIIKEAMKKMVLNFNSDPKKILAAVGPHIRKCQYWLKEKTYQDLRNTRFKKYFSQKKRKIYFDLTKLVFDEFSKLGIRKENIEDGGICTYCQFKKYFSARKQEESPSIYKEKAPRFASFIGLKL